MEKTKAEMKISVVTVCLGIYFMLMVFDSIPMFGIGSILRVLILLPVGAVIIIKLRGSLEINAQIVLTAAYVLFLAISYLYSINRTETYKQVSRVLLNIAVVLCAGGMYEYNEKEIGFLKLCLAAGGIITVLLAFFMADSGGGDRLTISINGAQQDQNLLNGYVFFAYVYFLTEILQKKRIIMIAPVAVIVYFTLMTGSRGALVALGGMSAAAVFCVFFRGKPVKLSAVATVAVSVLLITQLYEPVLALLPEEIAVRYTSEYIETYGNTGRTEIWKYLLNRFAESNLFRTLFGYGFGTVAYLNEYNHLVAHNMWIEHLLAVGVIGEILFISMQASYLRAAWKSKDVFVICTYVGYLIMMLSLTLLCYKPIWNCMIMILIISRHRNAEKTREAEGSAK